MTNLQKKGKFKEWLKLKMDLSRECLKRNKVFFDTAASFLLAVMSIILSAVSVSLGLKANELQERQALIELQQNLPLFGVFEPSNDTDYAYNGKIYPWVSEINLINSGGQIGNAQLTATNCIKVSISNTTNNQKDTIIFRNVEGYLKDTAAYNPTTKSFTVLKNVRGNRSELIRSLEQQLSEAYSTRVINVFEGDSFCLTYNDFQGEWVQNFYDLHYFDYFECYSPNKRWYCDLIKSEDNLYHNTIVELNFDSMTNEEICREVMKSLAIYLHPVGAAQSVRI